MAVVRTELRGMSTFIKGLGRIREKSIPYAARGALNDTAFTMRGVMQGSIRARFIIRHPTWTTRSIHVRKVKGRRLDNMYSQAGSVQKYMETQEKGGKSRKNPKFKHKPIATNKAAGQASGGKRRRLQRRRNRNKVMGHTEAPKWSKNMKWAQRMAISIKFARKQGRRTIVLKEGVGKKGAYKRAGAFSFTKHKAHMLWYHGKEEVKIKKEEWLQPTLPGVPRIFDTHFQKHIKRQIKFNNM